MSKLMEKKIDLLSEMKEYKLDPVKEVTDQLAIISDQERYAISNLRFRALGSHRETIVHQTKGKIYHIDEIQKVCAKYDLKLLSPDDYAGPIHPLLGANILAFQKANPHLYNLTYHRCYKLLAPRESFDVYEDRDPILFFEMGHGYHAVVDQWGRDMTIARRLTAIKHMFTLHGCRRGYKHPFWSVFVLSLIFTAVAYGLTMALACIPNLRWLFGHYTVNGATCAALFTFLATWPFIEYQSRKAEFNKTDVEVQN